jgi:hypothetical protein
VFARVCAYRSLRYSHATWIRVQHAETHTNTRIPTLYSDPHPHTIHSMPTLYSETHTNTLILYSETHATPILTLFCDTHTLGYLRTGKRKTQKTKKNKKTRHSDLVPTVHPDTHTALQCLKTIALRCEHGPISALQQARRSIWSEEG